MGWAKYNEDDREICEDRWAMREADLGRKETQQTSSQRKYKYPEKKLLSKEFVREESNSRTKHT